MAYEKKEGDGILFKSKEKKSDRSPDYWGEVLINGQLYKLAGWIKDTKNGGKFIAMKASLPDDQPAPQAHSTAAADDKFEDEIPF